MTKKKIGRPLKDDEPKKRINLNVPQGARDGLMRMINDYIALYRKQKLAEKLPKK